MSTICLGGRRMVRKVGIIGAPITIGQPKFGVDLGPKAIRYAWLYEQLASLKVGYVDYGDLDVPANGKDMIDPDTKLKNLESVAQGNEIIAKKVEEVHSRGEFPLILGGDHSIAIGTVAGLYKNFENLGVIWFDAHADVNSGETSPSGNIHGMSLAVNLGIGNDRLTSINGNGQKVKPEHIVIIGAREIDPGEKKLIQELGIKVYSMNDIEKRGIEKVMAEAIDYLQSQTDGVHLSFDVDGLDPIHTPGTGTPVDAGITLREAHLVMEMLRESQLISSLEIVEVNPLLDHENKTAELTVDLLATFFDEQNIKIG